MVPSDKVKTVSPNTPVEEAMELVLENKIGSIVVIEHQSPVGIITKSDVVKAYKSDIPTSAPCKRIMCKGPLHTCTPRMSRKNAARIMETERTHHLIVVDENNSSFLGLLSSWDIASDCAHGGWPWLHFEEEHTADVSSHGYPTIVHHKHDDRTFADTLDLLQFQ